MALIFQVGISKSTPEKDSSLCSVCFVHEIWLSVIVEFVFLLCFSISLSLVVYTEYYLLSTFLLILHYLLFPDQTISCSLTPKAIPNKNNLIVHSTTCCRSVLNSDEEDKLLPCGNHTRRGLLFLAFVSSGLSPALQSSAKTKSKNPYDEKRLLEQNKRIQRENNVPGDFPNFVREGFKVKVVTSDKYVTRDSGLILWDVAVGQGDSPKAGQQVIFHYIGYNESGRRIDSTYLQGAPAKVRMGTNALIPGFEEGLRDMKPGGKRRIIVPPELGPPVGPSTFFSSKQFEVFDVELVGIQDCTRRTIGFYSDVVCT
ncbi:hypothetical protein Leryth_017469 [Lithospermum erythrorhizon]|nr:hypothetical protein Leryth_017469 [Lithospermum erythrorhizon]